MALFAVISTILIVPPVLTMGISYLYVDTLLGQACQNQPGLMTANFHDPALLQDVRLSPPGQADLILKGWYVNGTNGTAVIILPGAYGGRDMTYQEANFLHQAGYSILTYDTRSCADTPRITTLGYAETAELGAAVDFLQSRPGREGEPIAVLGFSQGGATAILGAAQDSRIQATIAVSNYADLKLDIREGINWRDDPLAWWSLMWVETFYEWRTGIEAEQVSPLNNIAYISPRPVFLIHGSVEERDSRGLAQFAAAQEPKRFWLVEGADHGKHLSLAPESYRQHILDFLAEFLPHDD